VNLPEWVPDVALSHLLSNEDRVFDGVGKGSGTVSWVIQGEREDGAPFAVTRSDVYASEYDLTWDTALDVYMALSRIAGARSETLTIESVDTDSDLTRELEMATIEGVEIKQGKKWVPVGKRLVLPAGETATFKVELLSTVDGPTSVQVQLPVRAKDAGRRGYFSLIGGNSMWGGFGGRNAPVEKLIDRIENAPHNDDVVATYRLWRERRNQRNVTVEESTSFGIPVDGGMDTRLRIIG